MRKAIVVILALAALTFLAACNEGAPLGPAGNSPDKASGIPALEMGRVHNDLMDHALGLYKSLDDLKGTYGFFAGGEMESFTVSYLQKNYGIPAATALAWCRDAQATPYPSHWMQNGKPTPLKTWLDPERAGQMIDAAVRRGDLTDVGGRIAKDAYSQVYVMPGGCTWEDVKKYLDGRIRGVPAGDRNAQAMLSVLRASIELQQERLGMGDTETTPPTLWSIVAGVDATVWCASLNPCLTMGASVAAYIWETWDD